jgi:hypothetical protein
LLEFQTHGEVLTPQPFSVFHMHVAAGYFAGAELAVRPQQIAHVLQLFGFVPGSEYVAAAAYAAKTGAEVRPIIELPALSAPKGVPGHC